MHAFRFHKELYVLLVLLLIQCACKRPVDVDGSESRPARSFAATNDSRLANAAAEPAQWMTYGGTYNEQRFSPLDQINRATVSRLGLHWFADYDTNLRQEGTPLYIDGVLYVSTSWSKVHAFDADNGHMLWTYDPKVPPEWAIKLCCGPVNRGVAAWEGKIYVGTLDGRLVALDARNGREVWSVLTIDSSLNYSITGAPRVAKGNVLIGNAGADFGVRGYLTAYDAATGKLKWRFYTVPGNPKNGFENEIMQRAATTWTGEWWKLGGGGTVWDSFVYDPVTDLIYIGVGNGSPWNARLRSPAGGDNLFLSSIVAVKAGSGEYVWHYQTTPAENWDYTATQHIMVADLKIDNRMRRVVMQAPKNGFFYVLDAHTGELLRADAYAKMNWADGVDLKSGRPKVRSEAWYIVGKPFNALPGVGGAHGWHPMAYSSKTGLVYIPIQEHYFPFIADEKWVPQPVGQNPGVDLGGIESYYRNNPLAPSSNEAFLQAWDPTAGREVWRSDRIEAIAPGGALATAGDLVFTGSGGYHDFRAYDAANGKLLWKSDVQTDAQAGPISYEIAGRQYIAVSVGGNPQAGYYSPNLSRLLVFGLDGRAELPPAPSYAPPVLDPPPDIASAEAVQRGKQQYSRYCAACHVDGVGQILAFPDLKLSPLLHSQEGFDGVVLLGARTSNGMPSFARLLHASDTADIRAYVIRRANESAGR